MIPSAVSYSQPFSRDSTNMLVVRVLWFAFCEIRVYVFNPTLHRRRAGHVKRDAAAKLFIAFEPGAPETLQVFLCPGFLWHSACTAQPESVGIRLAKLHASAPRSHGGVRAASEGVEDVV